jgi:membrane peptidoglycan carboxypeptidase
VQLAAAYSPFANGGTFYEPHMILRITGPSGQVLYQRRQEGEKVLRATSAFLMTSLLQSVTSSGTGAKLSAAGTPVAGKTGTVNMTGGGNRDIWMACYNSEIACAFWMGFDEPDQNHRLQGWVSGGDNTAAMARNYFKALYQNRDKPQFTRPEGIVALEIDKQAKLGKLQIDRQKAENEMRVKAFEAQSKMALAKQAQDAKMAMKMLEIQGEKELDQAALMRGDRSSGRTDLRGARL